MENLNKLQDFINKHSKFTDSLVKNLKIYDSGKYNSVTFIIKPRFDSYQIKVTLDEVVEMKIENLYQYSIWELDLKEDDEYYIFNPLPIASDMGNLYFKAKKINFEEI